MQLLSIRVENFEFGLSQLETVKLTESGGKFTVSGKFYWKKNITKKQQKIIY